MSDLTVEQINALHEGHNITIKLGWDYNLQFCEDCQEDLYEVSFDIEGAN
jgi:hypothetical protein